MSDRPDNDLEHDPALTAIYRAAAPDAPPAALDDAILAAARRAAGARPRPAGFSFARKLRVPLSIAAVLVLSVSLVTLLREAAPDLAAPPRADAPDSAAKLQMPASVEDGRAAPDRSFVSEAQPSKNLDLKPPQAGLPSGVGLYRPEIGERVPQDAAPEGLAAGTAAHAPLAKRRDAVADAVDHRVAQEARAVGPLRQAAKPDALQEVAQAPATVAARAEPAHPAPEFAANPPASAPAGGGVGGRLAESKPQSAPASADRLEPAPRERFQSADQPSRRNADTLSAGPTPTAAPAPPPAAPQAKSSSASAPAVKLERTVDLTPGKWLERIEELRRSGRLDEAKAEFAEFRKRYPDYRVPESLRDWVKP